MLESPLVSGLIQALWERAKSRDLVQAWNTKVQEELKAPAFQRDGAFIEGTMLPLMRLMSRYFDGEVRGLDKLPRDGGALLVGNHSGGAITPDTTVLISAFYDAFGTDRKLVLLALDAIFGIPAFNTMCRRLGLVPASGDNAARALGEGSPVLVYPGGADEAFRPWRERNRVDLRGRKGFVRLALSAGVPVVPVVAHGGHETTFVVSRGEELAVTMGMRRMRLDIFPILLQFPWGVSTPATPGLPLPAKITIEVCDPLDWSRFGPEGARDQRVIDHCYDEVSTVMQRTLDRLASERPRPLVDGLRRLLPR